MYKVSENFELIKSKIPVEENMDLAKIYGIQNIYFDLDKWNIGDQAPDYIFAGDQKVSTNLPESLDIIQN